MYVTGDFDWQKIGQGQLQITNIYTNRPNSVNADIMKEFMNS